MNEVTKEVVEQPLGVPEVYIEDAKKRAAAEAKEEAPRVVL